MSIPIVITSLQAAKLKPLEFELRDAKLRLIIVKNLSDGDVVCSCHIRAVP